MRPEEIDSATLPVVMRGYDRVATEELLRRIAWDYHGVTHSQAVTAEEAQRLRQRVEELENEAAQAHRVFEQQEALHRAEFEHELQKRTAPFEAEIARLRQELSEHEHRSELTRTLLASAQRGARELREATRVECEGLLKAARRRAAEIEGDAHISLRHAVGEVERLHRLEADLREQLRRTLQAVLEPPRPDPAPEHEQQPPLGVV
jgi:cell division septum initiation protein DivIVA